MGTTNNSIQCLTRDGAVAVAKLAGKLENWLSTLWGFGAFSVFGSLSPCAYPFSSVLIYGQAPGLHTCSDVASIVMGPQMLFHHSTCGSEERDGLSSAFMKPHTRRKVTARRVSPSTSNRQGSAGQHAQSGWGSHEGGKVSGKGGVSTCKRDTCRAVSLTSSQLLSALCVLPSEVQDILLACLLELVLTFSKQHFGYYIISLMQQGQIEESATSNVTFQGVCFIIINS